MSIPRQDIDWKHYAEKFKATDPDSRKGFDNAYAQSIGLTPGNFAQYKRRYYRPQPAIVEMVDVPVETVELTPTSNSAETLADHETRLQVLESFVKVLQEHIQQPPVPHITVQPSTYALPSAESVQTWDDPDDAKPECWNLWLPHGIERRIEAQAKAAGIAPSQLVQRLLTAAINGLTGCKFCSRS